MKKLILVVGSDKIGTEAIYKIEKLNFSDQLDIIIDKSSNVKRVIKLFKRKILKPNLIFKLFFAELLRKRHKIKTYPLIRKKEELEKKIKIIRPDIVLLYRCGLILNKKILDLPPLFLNIHANSLPDYGGLGTINKALKNNALNQNATLHQVISKIDSGKVVDEVPYQLKKEIFYYKNEKIAYNAALKLLIKSLKGFLNSNNYKKLNR